jgi:G:T/U-mismatch repair DNA glycosylase
MPSSLTCPIERHQFISSWESALSPLLKEKHKQCWVNDSNHKYFGFFPSKMKAFFLGTFPVPEVASSDFFYHSAANLFWPILSELSDKNLDTLEAKLNWLSEVGIGITDILHTVRRTDELCICTADSALDVISTNNIHALLKDRPEVTDLFLTSGGPGSRSLSGKSAGGWLGKHLREASGTSIKKGPGRYASQEVVIKPELKRLKLHFLLTPAPQDDQLGKHLREHPSAKERLAELDFFRNITNVKEKYKVLQWAAYLKGVSGLISPRVATELEKIDLNGMLMERK